LRKNGNTSKQFISYLIGFMKDYDSGRRKIRYNILIEFGILTKLVRLIKLCLTGTYGRVRVGKNLSEIFPIKMV
jgi:hypothetical protein